MENAQILYAIGTALTGVAGFLVRRVFDGADKLRKDVDEQAMTIQRHVQLLASLREKIAILPDMQKDYYQFFGREKDTLWKNVDELKRDMQNLEKQHLVLVQKIEDQS